MPDFQPPPTWADVIIVDDRTQKAKFNPVWLKWFVDLVGFINTSGGATGVNHNDLAGLQGGTANQFYHLTSAQNSLVGTIVSGVWTPTLFNVTNVAASTAYEGQYLRVNTTVVASGRVDVDPTGAGATELGISLPVASNFGATEDCAGTAAATAVAGQEAAILADATNDRASMQWTAVDIANRGMFYIMAYQVI